MLRTTLYGTLTHDKELNKNEKAMLYIKECAELTGLEVIEGETAFSITFMAEIMKKLKETVNSQHQWIPVSEELPKPYEQVLRTVKSIGWNSTFHIHVDIGTICPADKEVIAWMPLPEPYKEGE